MSDTLSNIDEIVEPTRHIFLSPHYDDIALSCGGTAALLSQHGRQPEVALIFGSPPDPETPLTSFAESLHANWGLDATQVIASRRAEEALAGVVLGTIDTFLPFRDAIYRGSRYVSDDDLFGEVAADESSLPDAIIESLSLEDGAQATSRIYAPLAIGHHVDHQIAFAAGVQLAETGWAVWFYEDLPYALRGGARQQRLEATGKPFAPAATVPVDATWDQKMAAIMAYPSQLATIFAYVDAGSSREKIDRVMRDYARDNGGGVSAERLWQRALI